MGLGVMFRKFLLARQIEIEKGQIIILGVRSTIATTSMLISIHEEIIKKLGYEGIKILYEAGKIGGRELAKSLEDKVGLKGMELINSLATGCSELTGWGIITPTNCDFSNFTVIFEVENSPLSLSRRSSAFCHLERGLIAGAMEMVFKRRVDGIETKCRSIGQPNCEFIIKPTEEFDLNSKLVHEQLPIEEIVKTKKKMGLPIPKKFKKYSLKS